MRLTLIRRIALLAVAPVLLLAGLAAIRPLASAATAGGPSARAGMVRAAGVVGAPRFVAAPRPAQTGSAARQACATPTRPGQMQCQALARTNVPGHLGVTPGVIPAGFSPAQLQSAYNLPSSSAGSGETVAIVDAYNDPNAASDLAIYRQQYGLPACGTASGCLSIVSQTGGSSLPVADPTGGWELEESTDLDMVSAICPDCHILLVEAASSTIGDLAAAEDYAAAHAKFVSNSWGSGREFIGETSYDSAFNHPGVAIVAASGDSGYGTQYPAASQFVTSVGGTQLSYDSASGTWQRSAWSGTGSGCSTLEPASYSVSTDPGCISRVENDVSAVASPSTPVAVYDSYLGAPTAGWNAVGGTSVATAIITGVYALAGNPLPNTYPSGYPVLSGSGYPNPGLTDVTTGSNGSCDSQYLCQAMNGYDGPTGYGVPNGVTAFRAPTGHNVVTLLTPAPLVYEIGQSVSLQLHGYDSAGLPLTYSDPLPYVLPPGVTISASGLISGTPSGGQYDSYTQIVAQDSTGMSETAGFNVAGVPSLRTSFHPVAGPVRFGVAGRCLDDRRNKSWNGNPVVVWTCNGSAPQDWTYLPDGNPGGAGTLRIHGKCLNIKGTASGSRAVLWTCNGSPRQEWFLAGSGQLVSPVSGRCLAGPASGANGTQVRIYDCTGAASQSWTPPASPVPSGVAGMCLNDRRNKTWNGNPIQVASCDGSTRQDWVVASDGTVRIHGKCLAVSGQSMFDGARIVLWSCTSALAASEQWLPGPNGELINARSGKCLLDPGASAVSGTVLQQGNCFVDYVGHIPGEVWALS